MDILIDATSLVEQDMIVEVKSQNSSSELH